MTLSARAVAKIGFVFLSVVYVACGLYCNNRRLPFKLTNFLQDKNPVRQQYERYDHLFGNNRTVFVMAEKADESAFSAAEAQEVLTDVHWTLDRSHAITSVVSLNNAEYLKVSRDGVRMLPFLADGASMSKEAETHLDSEFWQNTLISRDRRHLLVTATLAKAVIGTSTERVLIADILTRIESVRQKHPAWAFHTLGEKVGEYYLIDDAIKTQRFITPLLLLALALIVIYLFRSAGILLFFLHTLLLSYASTILFIYFHAGGINAYAGFSIFFVMIIACSELIHFFTAFQYIKTDNINEKIAKTYRQVFVPCSLTCLSTVIGFSTLMLSDIKPISDLGFYSAVSEVLAFGITFTIMPLGLKIFDFRHHSTRTMPAFNVRRLLGLSIRHPLKIIGLFVFLGLLCYQLSAGLETNDAFYDQFHKQHPVSQALAKFSEHFQFLDFAEISMKFPEDSDPESPAAQIAMRAFEREIAALPAVSDIKSHAVFYEYLRSLLAQNDPQANPEKPRRFGNIYGLATDLGLLDGFYSAEDHSFRTTVYIRDSKSKGVLTLMDQIQRIYDARYKDRFKMEFMGSATLRAYLGKNLVADMAGSVGTEIFLVFIVFVFVFRSVKLAFLGLLPNIIPLVFIGALMRIFAIPLQTNIVLLINITFGIAVDDTIHFIYPISVKLREGTHKVTDILHEVFEETSESLVGTTMVIVFCFPCFYLADLKIYTQTGTLVMMALLFGLITELCLTPALILKTCRQGEWSAWKWVETRLAARRAKQSLPTNPSHANN